MSRWCSHLKSGRMLRSQNETGKSERVLNGERNQAVTLADCRR